MLETKEIVSIIIIVILIATYLTIFYFKYGTTIEKNVVVEQVNYIVDDFTKDLSLVSPQHLADLKDFVRQVKRPNMDEEDANAEAHNKAIEQQSMKIIFVACAIGIVISYLASKHYNFSIVELMKKNLLLLAFIAATEISFLMVFARNYMSADPNYVKLVILDKIS